MRTHKSETGTSENKIYRLFNNLCKSGTYYGISRNLIFLLMIWGAVGIPTGSTLAQEIVMPHNGTDTVYVTKSACMTILDPGGIYNYFHNEDSWLYVLSDDDAFNLDINYETGPYDDGNDYIEVFYDTTEYSSRSYIGGKGQKTLSMNRRCLIHFHSNQYGAYHGFEIKVKFYNGIGNSHAVVTGPASARISWTDENVSSTSWQVVYSNCDDHYDTVTTDVPYADLTNLDKNCNYRYWVFNNTVTCATDRKWTFRTYCDPGVIPGALDANSWDTLANEMCYRTVSVTGDNNKVLEDCYGYTHLVIPSGDDFYLMGSYLRRGTLYCYLQTSTWGTIGYSLPGSEESCSVYFPGGNGYIYTNGRSNFYDFRVVRENGYLITPNITASNTTADISWTDVSGSTSWTVRYAKDENNWTERQVTSPMISLSELEPGTQYVFTIVGNLPGTDCVTGKRHSFFTTNGSANEFLMPYRGNDTVTINPGQCYKVYDAGGKNNGYFENGEGHLRIQSANGKGFTLKGMCNLGHNTQYMNDRLQISIGSNSYQYTSSTSGIDIFCPNGYADLTFLSGDGAVGQGFEFQIKQVDNDIFNIQSTVTQTTATLTWDDRNSTSTRWKVHYGPSEDEMLIAITDTKQLNLTGLKPGTQYVWWVENDSFCSTCNYNDRKAFITTGSSWYKLMPFRGIDTVLVDENICTQVLDGGGTDYPYFDNDTSTMVFLSENGQNFKVYVNFEFENEYDYYYNGYDGNDKLWVGYNSANPYEMSASYYTSYSNYSNNGMLVFESRNGFLSLQFRTNSSIHGVGYKITLFNKSSNITNVQTTNVKNTTATITWADNSDASAWKVWYGTEDSAPNELTVTSPRANLTNLAPNTRYRYWVTPDTVTQPYVCNGWQQYQFTTLDANAIFMNYRSNDTVYITPYNCYTVYDVGGEGPYLPNDTSTITIISTTGQGFYYSLISQMGDYSDQFWDSGSWCHNGQARFDIKTNEEYQGMGFIAKILFYPSIYDIDQQNLTDSSVTIIWQDSSSATQWEVSYGSDMDSLQTITTTTPSASLTGLRRNQQYYYTIQNNATEQQCVLPVAFGVTTPCDAGINIVEYQNSYANSVGLRPNYYTGTIHIDPTQCTRILSNGVNNKPFANCSSSTSMYASNGRGFSIKGNYDLDASSLDVSGSDMYNYFSGFGYIDMLNQSNHMSIYTYSGSNTTTLGNGYDLKIYMDYPIYNFTSLPINDTTETISWQDSSSATQWTVVYGPDEYNQDTIVTNTHTVTLTGLEPDQQYACYISNNLPECACMEPMRHSFVTTNDTTIIIVPFYGSTTRVMNVNECYELKDPGADHDYFFNTNSTVRIKSATGDAFVLRGWANIEENDYVYIYDENTGNTYWSNYGGYDPNAKVEVPANTVARLVFISYGDTSVKSGFHFKVFFNTIYDIQTELMTDTSCRVTWKDHSTATSWVFHYGDDQNPSLMDSIETDKKRVHLNGLVDGKMYYVYVTNNATTCVDTTWFKFCAGGDDCIDFADIYGCHTTCRYGRYSNPDENEGTLDYGYTSVDSRHTVVTDTTMTDPRTGNSLRCVPVGYTESVRLGNWDYGGQAESITYEYIVDTMKTEALLLRYAVVLEHPGHAPENQPKFNLSFVDENDIPIYPECYSADFVASSSLGWNTYIYDTTTVLWKDWTPVGINLSPLHGRRVFVKFTTYDCNEMGHFGYAYFTMECIDKNISYQNCGQVSENTFIAPEGFDYTWYRTDNNQVVSTDRTFSTNNVGKYICRCSSKSATPGSECYFEKTVEVGSIYPYAQFTYEILDTIGCEVMVQFINRSIVTEDSLHTIGTQQECEQFVWDFGDGDTSYEKNPRHIFPAEQFNVTLTAMLSNGSCNDDTTMTLLIPSPCITYDTIDTDICDLDTLWVRGTPYTTSGEYLLRTEFRADSIQETFINLRVHPVYDTSMNGGICNGEAYTYFGFNENTEGDYINHQYTNIYHCDSIYRLHLVVAPVYDTVTYPEICDNASYQLRDSLTTIPGIYIDSLHSIYMCDSVVTVNLTVHPTYYNTHPEFICDNDSILFIGNYYKDSGTYEIPDTTIYGCDSTEVLQLTLNSTYEFFDTNYFCQHTAFTFDGWDYTAPDEWDIPYLTGAGCDSIYHMVLNYYDSNYHAGILLSIDSSYWFGPDTLVGGCAPFTLYLKNDSQGDSILTWYFGDGDSSSIANTSHVYDTGTYTLTLVTLSPDGCLDTLKIIDSIRVYSRPVAGFTWDPPVLKIPDPEITLINTSRPDDSLSYYLWNIQLLPNGDYDTSTAINPHYTFSGSTELLGMHEIMLVAYLDYLMENGKTHTCTDTISDSIKITNTLLQFPNLVTPNGDGHNDTYVVINLVEEENYPINRLTIYDRWGNIVYDKKNISDLSDFWDPNLHNNPDGTYYYRFHGQGRFGHVDRKGAIEVIRGEE